MADEVPFSQKYTEIEELPTDHPLRVSEEMKAENPLAAQVLADFYAVRSGQPPRLEQTSEVMDWMGWFAAGYEKLMIGFKMQALRKPGL